MRARDQKRAQKKLMEEQEAAELHENQKRFEMQLRLAKVSSNMMKMNEMRQDRDQINNYQNRVIKELIRRPPTFYYFQASEEALERVRNKLHRHKGRIATDEADKLDRLNDMLT